MKHGTSERKKPWIVRLDNKKLTKDSSEKEKQKNVNSGRENNRKKGNSGNKESEKDTSEQEEFEKVHFWKGTI